MKNKTTDFVYFDCWGEHCDIPSISSHTITHLCPIASEYSISDFVVGAPVYMSGKVYKHVKDEWVESTASDTTDCISSVCTNGTWKKYLGICVEIVNEKEIKFASHGDYLVKVSDSSVFGVGDTVYNDDGILKILSDEANINTKIKRMTVGVVTSIIDSSTLAVFKE